MPELPEVQTVVSDLQAQITGDQITGFWTAWPSAISLQLKEKKAVVKTFSNLIAGQKILAVQRIGKYIVFTLSNNLSLLIHLRMTGKLVISHQSSVIDNQKAHGKHTHHIFFLQKNKALVFHDVRKFGTITLLQTSHLHNFKGISILGLDPTSSAFTLPTLKKMLQTKEKMGLKDFLMNQSLISGIGNIYASEILFDAKLRPIRPVGSLSALEIKHLHLSIKKILAKAIQMRGTSVSDYRDAAGQKGSFQKVLKVYKKNGQPCQKCATIIEKTIIGQRSTFYCPYCQH